MRRLTLLLLVVAGCKKAALPPPPSVDSGFDSGVAVADAAIEDVSVAMIVRIDAGPLKESLEGFDGKVDPLPIELLPSDQRKRADGKPGPVRIATVKDGLALFGLKTADVAEGPMTRGYFAHSKKHASSSANWEEMVDRWGPDPKPSLLVLEDSSRAPVAVRFVGVPLKIEEVKIPDLGQVFSIQTLRGPSGIDDPIDLDVVALRSGELTLLLHAYLGFRDIEPCSSGSKMSVLGPPGTAEVLADGKLRVRDATIDCDSPAKVILGCKGSERDFTWDGAKLVAGAQKLVTYTTTRTSCP